METKKPVVVTDYHRGIVFGYLVETLEGGNAVRLENARHCYGYVIEENDDGDKGFCALATVGPCEGSKIGPRVNMIVRDISKIIDCSDEAVEKWEEAKWL